MSKNVTKAITVIYGFSELAGSLNKVSLKPMGEAEETTNLAGDGWREYMLGLRGFDLTLEGFLEFDANEEPEGLLMSHVTADGSVVVMLDPARPRADGDTVYFGQLKAFTHDRPMEVGKVFRFTQTLKGDAPLIRGKILETVTRTVTGNSSELTMPAVAAGERMYYALQILREVTGTLPTNDLILQSDVAGFATPTTRATLAQQTTHGTVFGYIDGPVTDTIWRATATLGGTTPSFPYVLSLGIVAAAG